MAFIPLQLLFYNYFNNIPLYRLHLNLLLTDGDKSNRWLNLQQNWHLIGCFLILVYDWLLH